MPLTTLHLDLARSAAASQLCSQRSSLGLQPRFQGARSAGRSAGSGHRHSLRLRASSVDDESTFGKPQAPRDLWENYAKAFRKGLFDELAKPAEEQDVIIAALLVGGEDDAISSRTAVRLPVEAYVARVESMVADILVHFEMEAPSSNAERLAIVDTYLYQTQRYRTPEGWKENFSPYRTYVHNVLAQKVGVPATLAAIHLGVLRRLEQRGALPFRAEVVLTSGPNSRPFAREADKGAIDSPLWVAASPKLVVRSTLETLKRAFWAWDWDQGSPSGFLRAARAALGDAGRVGSVVAGTVMQPTGRPFGDVERAALATERLMELEGGGAGGGAARFSTLHARDLAVLRFHQGRYAESAELLQGYLASPAGRAAEAEAGAPSETILVALPQEQAGAGPQASRALAKEEFLAARALVSRLERVRLEGLYNAQPAGAREIE